MCLKGGIKLNLFLALLIIAVAVVTDYFWFDSYGNRWGWMKNWSKWKKSVFFSVIIIVGVVTYLADGMKYINF